MNPDAWFAAVAGVGRHSLEWFWIPLLAWTVVAGGGWVISARAHWVHPLLAYRLRQALLFSLPAVLILAPWTPAFASTPDVLGVFPGGSHPMSWSSATGESGASMDGLGLLLGVAILAVGVSTAFHLTRLIRQLHRLQQIAVLADRLEDPRALRTLRELASELGVRRPVALLGAANDSIPMTFHWTTPWILIPRSLCRKPEYLRIVLAHELIHIRRADAVWSVIERTVSAPFVFHPLVRRLGRSIGRFREASCDAEVITTGVAEPRTYAKLLLDLSREARPTNLAAPALFTRQPNLKTRIELMKRLTQSRPSRNLGARSLATAALLFVGTVGLAACGSRAPSPASAPADLAEQVTSRFGPMANGTRDAALARLDVQMAYLHERVEAVRADLQAGEQAGERLGGHVYQQYELLSGMYLERLETYETLKLERETELRLGDGGQ